MKLAVYFVDGSGERAAEPWATLEFKRQKSAPKKITNKTTKAPKAKAM